MTRSWPVFFIACVFVLASFQVRSAGQGAKPFTAEDMLKVASISVSDMTDDGRMLSAIVRRSYDNAETDNYRYGDPTYLGPSRATLLVIDTTTGATATPFKELTTVRQTAWSHDGKRLAIFVTASPSQPGSRPDTGVRKGAATLATKGGQAASPPADPTMPVTKLYVWDVGRAALVEIPAKAGLTLSLNSGLEWTPDDHRLIVTLRTPEWDKEARERFTALTRGPIIVQSSKEPFLEWDALQRSARTRTLATVDVATGEVVKLQPELKLSSYTVARDGSFATYMEDVTEKTDYDTIGGTDNALRLVSLQPGAKPKTLVEAKDLKGLTLRWSDDGRTFAYAKKGEVFIQGVDEAKPKSLTPPPPEQKKAEAGKAEAAAGDAAAEKKEEKESFSVSMFSRDGSRLLITSKKGWYVVTVADAKRERVLTLNEDDEEKNPRMEPIAWSPDGAALYLTYGERDRWERGVSRLEVATKAITPLIRDARLYGGVRMARDGSRFVFTMSDGDTPADLHVTGADFKSIRRLSDVNPWIADRALPKSELVAYRDVDGKQLYGVLRYPVNYVKGQKYPTVFELYETFFDNGFNGRAAFLSNHGYAVFHPSVNLVIGQPGEAWVKGVTTAANRLIDMGIADPDRLGVHGTSYGGYATVLLITQTDRFKAAVNVSGKVDMVSFYTDSPRLGVRNIHAPEKSQDRIGGTLWEYPERYLEHSAILHADRVKTPLLCITGDQDPNVPASQSREIYYALRRLGKEVEWVRYVNGAHRPPNSVAESVDFEQRILGWYDRFLKKDGKKQ
jgi:dipeptidyl aminopeptidase/acylaminoacyl peptidase